jgi:phage baseplate assembly protein W
MSTEIAVPFQLAQDGGVGVLTNTLAQSGQHVEALVATGPGERVVLGGYGVAAARSVFAPSDRIVAQMLQNDVAQAMQTWEPAINVISVNAVAQVGNPANSATITVNWSPTNSAQSPADPGVYTSTILVGGSVI